MAKIGSIPTNRVNLQLMLAVTDRERRCRAAVRPATRRVGRIAEMQRRVKVGG